MKKNLLAVLILALTIVNLIMTSVMMVSVMGTNKKVAKLVGNIATVLNFEYIQPGEEDVKEEISLADTDVFNLTGSMTIPLKTDASNPKQVYIIFDLSLSMNMKHADYKKYGGDAIANRESLIKDAVTSVVTGYTELECRNDFEGLKADILEAIQSLFQSDFIYSVSISGIKFG